MRKLSMLLPCLLAGYSSYAQFTTNNGVTTTLDKVGIGITDPKSTVEIRKDAQGAQGPVLELTNGSGSLGASSEIYFSTYARALTGVPSARIKVADNADWGGNFMIETKGSGASAPLYPRLFIQGATGNVGIGTTNPIGLFNLKGSSVGGMLRLNPTVDNGEASISISPFADDNNSNNRWIIGSGAWNSGDKLVIGNSSYNGALMTFKPDGTISVGTADSKGYKFAVAGKMVAEEVNVKLQSAWPDYVFKSSYKLPTLRDVKSYIDKNKHLPDMPSEQEVAKEGISLGEMNRILVKKMEEMTLYMITQNKQLVRQKALNTTIFHKLSRLEHKYFSKKRKIRRF